MSIPKTISVTALIAALGSLATALVTRDVHAAGASILAIVTVFLPALSLLPWFQSKPDPTPGQPTPA